MHLSQLNKNAFKGGVIALLVIIGTFPENEWIFRPGIDPPLAWVFNFLFENGLGMGKSIVFPHGPLAFFMYPQPENILISTLVDSLLKTLLVFNVFSIVPDLKQNLRWIIALFAAYFISIVSGFNQLLIANVILLYSNYFITEKTRSQKTFKYVAFLITALAFYVKLYVAIVVSVLGFSFMLINFANDRNFKSLLLDGISVIGLIYLFWVISFRSFAGFFQYLLGVFHLALDNSAAVSFYPYNMWWILVLFFLALILIIVVNWGKRSNRFWLLIALSFFAAWKHGMAREDIFHARGFLIFTLICLIIYVLYNDKKRYVTLVLAVVAVFLFSINLQRSFNYFPSKYEIIRSNNFVEFLTDFKELKRKSLDKTKQNIERNKLPDSFTHTIGTSRTDVYPWDYSIIAANGLTWQPRRVIHSYASYTPWLDTQNADHFKSVNAPDFLIWHFDKITNDVNGGGINSIDGRYLLNDEPRTIIQIINNYSFFDFENKFTLLRKRESPLNPVINLVSKDTITWGEWINVPKYGNSILRTKLSFKKGIIQRLKSFLYKDEQFWIYLKLSNGSIHKYRFVPKNAVDGLWINPYLFNLEQEFDVEQVLFKGSNQQILTERLYIDWEHIQYPGGQFSMSEFFNIKDTSQLSVNYRTDNSFEDIQKGYWKTNGDARTQEVSFEGQFSELVKANSFSSTMAFPLDSIEFQNLRIETDCWVTASDYKMPNSLLLVLAIDKNGESVEWKGLSVDGQLIDKRTWNNIYNYIHYKHSMENCKLNAYLYNTSRHDIFLDNFRVVIAGENLPFE